ncbi:type IV pilus biogenesis/stability protein PilW [Pectobacterium parmentieri]|uniref:Type IV pilus biogenesis/stability protein PilW n=1 Tax=Pectobacterium parmentieri TaxID=1905730 RepID=A0A8B3F5U4_PECPM|nr:type IV pilus biogenesis/stability protein PilW [Pectobacterium parmentieri]AOR59733.1 type IV pilus biogenesis/stability protein PilW [Pectobacterium parmentieri]AYH09271.1 type IV pilus biogenesis/stability protein PilW [Pectobacterium parmentieri]AYH19967.1 type IV pilus biogenesis/stability protein PilW [Pectobacterium parmentieri]AYH35637.1 type IV pilus biogenesis/stability protein PilW [Pectobacterium parmentieri]AZS55704.1 type IV pilus biogenesis/stability protein PilW [Pectobacter
MAKPLLQGLSLLHGRALSPLSNLFAILLLVGCVNSPHEVTNPAVAQTRLQLGLAYLARNNLDSARQNLEKAVAVAPQDYRTQLGMALYEQRIGENRLAEQRYQQVLNMVPENGSVMNNYGAFLCSLGQYVAAQRQFSAAAQLPDYSQVADALENAGYCFFNAGRVDDARNLLSRALKYDPKKGVALLAEANQQFSAGKSEQARLLIEIYQHSLPASAESLWLQIRFAALAGHDGDKERYGNVLARSFPQSKQYQHFLANEY